MKRQLIRCERQLYFALHNRAIRLSKPNESKTMPRVKSQHLLTGERGEDEAYFYLRSRGYTIVARRWRSGRLRGDLDLVAWDGGTLVIFEVKTRTARDFAAPEAEVDDDKRRMLRRMAAAYIRQFPERHRGSVPVRFDVVSVYLLSHGSEFEHFPAAFRRTDADTY